MAKEFVVEGNTDQSNTNLIPVARYKSKIIEVEGYLDRKGDSRIRVKQELEGGYIFTDKLNITKGKDWKFRQLLYAAKIRQKAVGGKFTITDEMLINKEVYVDIGQYDLALDDGGTRKENTSRSYSAIDEEQVNLKDVPEEPAQEPLPEEKKQEVKSDGLDI